MAHQQKKIPKKRKAQFIGRPKIDASDAPEATEGPEKVADRQPPPWANAHPRVTINFSTKFAEELHMQMTWLTENVPKLSIQKIVQEATAQYVAKKIEEHYKP